MKYLTVPVPLFDNEMSVLAYSFRFQKGTGLFSDHEHTAFDGAFESPLLNLVGSIGLEALTLGKPIFVPVSHITLLVDLDENFNEDPTKVVFVLDKNFEIDELYVERVIRFKLLGFRFAVSSKIDLSYHTPLIRLCDYAFVDSKTMNPFEASKFFTGINKHISIIVSNIDNANTFRDVRFGGFSMFEGQFYRIPVSAGQNTVNPLKVNYIQLLNIVKDDNFDLEEVSKIIRHDTALAISLLKLVNSLGLNQEIRSINHASAMLGQIELRKWITTAVTKSLSADKPNEVTKLSLIRAKFAENLAPCFEMAIHAQSLFLMGLFSIIDVILDMPMPSALDVVPVSNAIRGALLYHRGDFYKVLEFMIDYETADWAAVSRLLILNNIETEAVLNAYIGALSWYGSMVAMADVEPDGTD